MKRLCLCVFIVIIILCTMGCKKMPVSQPASTSEITNPPVPTPSVPAPATTESNGAMADQTIGGYAEMKRITGCIELENGSSIDALWIPGGYTEDHQIVRDFDQDGADDVLAYKTEPMDASGNFPTVITLKIGEAEQSIDAPWNDGLLLFTYDFDTADDFIDIGITQRGTDIESTTHIYRYGDNGITAYASFSHVCDTLYADGTGKIYCNLNGAVGPESVDGYFDYKKRVIVAFED